MRAEHARLFALGNRKQHPEQTASRVFDPVERRGEALRVAGQFGRPQIRCKLTRTQKCELQEKDRKRRSNHEREDIERDNLAGEHHERQLQQDEEPREAREKDRNLLDHLGECKKGEIVIPNVADLMRKDTGDLAHAQPAQQPVGNDNYRLLRTTDRGCIRHARRHEIEHRYAPESRTLGKLTDHLVKLRSFIVAKRHGVSQQVYRRLPIRLGDKHYNRDADRRETDRTEEISPDGNERNDHEHGEKRCLQIPGDLAFSDFTREYTHDISNQLGSIDRRWSSDRATVSLQEPVLEITVFRDPVFELHEQPEMHPERPERIRAMYEMLDGASFAGSLVAGEPRDATDEELRAVHTAEYIDSVATSAERDLTVFDADTAANRHSYAAARRASGCASAAVDAVIDSSRRRALVASRPPGHHAEADHAAGFCFFNHVMVAACHALERGLERIFILDWDVHHGNGTFHSSYRRDDIFYASLHQYPHYPGTGRLGETGADAGSGRTLTIPLPGSCDDEDYLYLMHELVAPAVRSYRPDLLIVSAGFDAHQDDPLGSMQLSSRVYASFAALECELADELCDGRLIYVTEGGYNLTALRESLREATNVLTGSRADTEPTGAPNDRVREIAKQVRAVHGGF